MGGGGWGRCPLPTPKPLTYPARPTTENLVSSAFSDISAVKPLRFISSLSITRKCFSNENVQTAFHRFTFRACVFGLKLTYKNGCIKTDISAAVISKAWTSSSSVQNIETTNRCFYLYCIWRLYNNNNL